MQSFTLIPQKISQPNTRFPLFPNTWPFMARQIPVHRHWLFATLIIGSYMQSFTFMLKKIFILQHASPLFVIFRCPAVYEKLNPYTRVLAQ